MMSTGFHPGSARSYGAPPPGAVAFSSAILRASGLRFHTPISQTASNPKRASASHSESGTSARVIVLPRRAPNFSSHDQVLIS